MNVDPSGNPNQPLFAHDNDHHPSEMKAGMKGHGTEERTLGGQHHCLGMAVSCLNPAWAGHFLSGDKKPIEMTGSHYSLVDSINAGTVKVNKKNGCNKTFPRLPGFLRSKGKSTIADIRKLKHECETKKTVEQYKALATYLDTDEVCKKVKSLNGKKKSELLRELTGNKTIASYSLNTKTGIHLSAQPTSDQYLVALISETWRTSYLAEKYQTPNTPVIDVNFLKNRLTEMLNHKASHTPKWLHDELRLKEQSKSQISLVPPSLTKTCNYCYQDYTNQSQHNSLFHPEGVESKPVADNHEKNTRLVHSKSLMEHIRRIEPANESARVQADLLPPLVYKCYEQEFLVFSGQNEHCRLFPELFLSQPLCQKMSEVQKRYRDKCVDLVRNEKRHLESAEQDKVQQCYDMTLNLSQQLPGLAQIGRKLKELLKQRKIEIPAGSVPDQYLVELFASKSPPVKTSSSPICPQKKFADQMLQVHKRHPYLAGLKGKNSQPFFASDVPLDKLLRQAFKELNDESNSDVRTENGPIFIGFIPPKIANEIAMQDGFYDCIWPNPLHGQFSHSLQLTVLNISGKLNRDTLKAIVTKGLWGCIFDHNPYGKYAFTCQYSDPSLPFLMLNMDHELCRKYNSPFKYQELLTTGQLSASLTKILKAIELHPDSMQDSHLSTLADHMGLASLSKACLIAMTDNIRVLELVLATNHLHLLQEVTTADFKRKEVTSGDQPSDNSLYDPESLHPPEGTIGQFNNSGPGKEERAEANRLFNEDHLLHGISRNQAIPIKNKADIQKYRTFIAYPPKAE